MGKPRGARGRFTISKEDAEKIRLLYYKEKIKKSLLAERFSVHVNTITRVIKNEIWAEL